MENYSLYLHIPFCHHRCAYCDFNTYAGIEALIPPYVQALCREIRWVAEAAGESLPVHTVFFGGGTPSLLSLDELAEILEAVQKGYHLLPDAEITLEANPGTLSRDYLAGLRQSGVNRLSLGMQSALITELRFLERQHQLGDVVQAVRWARQAGFDNLNLDLIFGLPYQSLTDWEKSLEMALSLRPDHLSLYSLTLEHGTPLEHWVSRGIVSAPDNDLAADMYELAMDRLEQAGFAAYEISNWAKVDARGAPLACRHNLQYWRSQPYLGFGAGAHGFAKGMRTANVLSPSVYIQRLNHVEGAQAAEAPRGFPRSPAATSVIQLDRSASIGEYMMMGLRLVQEGVSNDDFRSRFGESLEDHFGVKIEKWIKAGLLEWVDGNRRIRLTRRGRLLGNIVFADFI